MVRIGALFILNPLSLLQWYNALRDIGICRQMNIGQTHKGSFSIMGPHIFKIKFNFINAHHMIRDLI